MRVSTVIAATLTTAVWLQGTLVSAAPPKDPQRSTAMRDLFGSNSARDDAVDQRNALLDEAKAALKARDYHKAHKLYQEHATLVAKAKARPKSSHGLGAVLAMRPLEPSSCNAASAADGSGHVEIARRELKRCLDELDRRGASTRVSGFGDSAACIANRKRQSQQRIRKRLRALDSIHDLRADITWALKDGDTAKALALSEKLKKRDPFCARYRPGPVNSASGLAAAAMGSGSNRCTHRKPLWGACIVPTAKALTTAVSDKQARVTMPTHLTKAPWLDRTRKPALRPASVVATPDHAVGHFGWPDAWLGVSAKGSLLGPLVLPKRHMFVGLTDSGSVLVADNSDVLWQAPSIAKAISRRGFKRVARLKGVDAWDVAGETVVAIDKDGKRAHISHDGGRSFGTPDTFEEPIAVGKARADGVVVIQTGSDVHTNQGGRWTTTSLGTTRHIQRTGEWIGLPRAWVRGDPTTSNCGEGVLAADGRSWVVMQNWPSTDFRNTPFSLVETRDRQRWFGVHSRKPLAPKDAATSMKAALKKCRADPERYFDNRGGGAGFLSGRSGGKVVMYPTPPELGPAAGLLGAKSDAAVVVSKGQLAIASLPEACVPLRVVSLTGLGAVACEGGGTVIIDVHGKMREQVKTVGEVVGGTVAPDGTALIQTTDGDQLRAWLRAPKALGADNAWREVSRDDGLGYRPVVGGRVLTVYGPEDGPYTVDIDNTPVATKVTLDVLGSSKRPRRRIDPEVLPDGRIRVGGYPGHIVLAKTGPLIKSRGR